MTRRINSRIVLAASSLVTILHHRRISVLVHAGEEYLCSIGPDGEEDCEAVYFEPDIDDVIINDHHHDDDFEEEEERWRMGLAVEECADRHAECPTYAEDGECESNPGFAKYQCAVSCGTCGDFDAAYEGMREGGGDGPCTDKHRECRDWAHMGECGFNPGFMLGECKRSCMVCYEDT